MAGRKKRSKSYGSRRRPAARPRTTPPAPPVEEPSLAEDPAVDEPAEPSDPGLDASDGQAADAPEAEPVETAEPSDPEPDPSDPPAGERLAEPDPDRPADPASVAKPARRPLLPRVRRRPVAPAPTPDEARRRLFRMSRPSINRGQLLAAGLTLLLGLALVVQVRSTGETGLSQLRQSELVALLDDASSRVDALQREVNALERDKERLQGEQGGAAALEAAQQRLDSYEILAGSVPVEGPGISVFVNDPERAITQTMLLDGIQELRDAGAEAIQIGGTRVVASSYVGSTSDGRVTLDGQAIAQPMRILAIGDSHTLSGAMAIPGGFSDSLRGVGADVEVTEHDSVQIDAVRELTDPRYARPVPASQAP
ncbi:DUF881 domain-containing protein [Ornithinimicrobium tianjinense]|uniref:Division initiation protein n=1 Tax=Ornithinimicrobium tianjinense TaxID=1195761 RepID=A0A917F2P5_9MICO|nr:DUF881 domain-containing protein [Ornithinimicrobium tianjinense]GGF47071.1 hypothetical protein GCM10011366_13560 [Ornithinimicrobium tianjinense]